MGILLEVAGEVASEPTTGVILLLVVLLGLAVWAYWQERQRNNKIQDERIAEAKEDTELVLSTLHDATQAVQEFTGSNEALRTAFEAFVRTQTTEAPDAH